MEKQNELCYNKDGDQVAETCEACDREEDLRALFFKYLWMSRKWLMMVHENDKFEIPAEYLRMSVSELERIADDELKKMKEARKNAPEKPDKFKESPVAINW